MLVSLRGVLLALETCGLVLCEVVAVPSGLDEESLSPQAAEETGGDQQSSLRAPLHSLPISQVSHPTTAVRLQDRSKNRSEDEVGGVGEEEGESRENGEDEIAERQAGEEQRKFYVR